MQGITHINTYIPEHALAFIEKWTADYSLRIKITNDRKSKLGDYRKIPPNTHLITLNSSLNQELFFFVLTHELAHLHAFEKYGSRISPHGKEWKLSFAMLLIESLTVYDKALQPLLLQFSKSPKANFMSSTELVRYFNHKPLAHDEFFIENLEKNTHFNYQGVTYQLQEKRKKLYLCTNLATGKKYLFKPIARVKKL